MRISRSASALASVIFGTALLFSAAPASAQTAVDAAQAMASAMDGAGGGISTTDQILALQDAATAGDPMALWQLGLMYESGQGVEQDKAKAFGYFSQIADPTDFVATGGVDADIVAQSNLKVGEYYRQGLPEVNLQPDPAEYERRVQYAATVLRNADAQYLLGELYSDTKGLGDIPVLSYRWLSLAARKGHVAAQAKLGDLLFNGDGKLEANPVEGLMWLTIASRRAVETADAEWIENILNADMSIATPDQRKKAVEMADQVGEKLASN